MAGALFLGLLALLATGIPIAMALGIVGLVGGYIVQGEGALLMLPQTLNASLNSFLIVAIPLFILMSEILKRGGLTEILFETVTKWIGHLPGGLGVSTVVTSAIGASVTGSSIANAASMGIVAVPAMLQRGYERKFVYGLVATGGTLGILIPPSIPMLLYGAITGESVGKLFIAGVVPGMMIAGILIGYVLFVSIRGRVYEPLPKASWPERWRQTRVAIWGLLLPPIVVGGIYFGVFTPTEAAGVGVIYALFVSFFVYRSITLRDLGPVLMSALQTTCMILLITACALILGNAITIMQVTQELVQLVNELNLAVWVFLIIINFLLLVLGCFLEVISITFIFLPLIYPILLNLQIDPIWFAVMFVVNMEIALITPPVGMVLYVITGIVHRPIIEVIRGVVPFVMLLFISLALIMLFPQLSLWLPGFAAR